MPTPISCSVVQSMTSNKWLELLLLPLPQRVPRMRCWGTNAGHTVGMFCLDTCQRHMTAFPQKRDLQAWKEDSQNDVAVGEIDMGRALTDC